MSFNPEFRKAVTAIADGRRVEGIVRVAEVIAPKGGTSSLLFRDFGTEAQKLSGDFSLSAHGPGASITLRLAPNGSGGSLTASTSGARGSLPIEVRVALERHEAVYILDALRKALPGARTGHTFAMNAVKGAFDFMGDLGAAADLATHCEMRVKVEAAAEMMWRNDLGVVEVVSDPIKNRTYLIGKARPDGKGVLGKYLLEIDVSDVAPGHLGRWPGEERVPRVTFYSDHELLQKIPTIVGWDALDILTEAFSACTGTAIKPSAASAEDRAKKVSSLSAMVPGDISGDAVAPLFDTISDIASKTGTAFDALVEGISHMANMMKSGDKKSDYALLPVPLEEESSGALGLAALLDGDDRDDTA